MERNIKKSKKWAKTLNPQPHECWKNSVIAAMINHATYVEGWVAFKLKSGGWFPLEHGWCIHDDEIVDITPAMLKHKEAKYFPGLEYSPRELETLMERHNELNLPLFGSIERRNPVAQAKMKQASEDAWACLESQEA